MLFAYFVPQIFLISASVHIATCSKDLRMTMSHLRDKWVKTFIWNSKWQWLHRKDDALSKTIAEAVTLHLNILKAWKLLSNIMSPILFFEFSFAGYILCSSLFGIASVSELNSCVISWRTFQKLLQGIDSGSTDKTLAAIFLATFNVGTLFMYCAVGEVVPSECAELSTTVYSSTEWYDKPPPARRHLVMFIRQAQQPLYLRGMELSVWECSLQNFTSVKKLDYRCIDSKMIVFLSWIFSWSRFAFQCCPAFGHLLELLHLSCHVVVV